MSLVLIHPAPDAAGAGTRLEGVLRSALGGREVRTLRRAEELNGLSGQKVLFALPLDEAGQNNEYQHMLGRDVYKRQVGDTSVTGMCAV